MAQLARLDRFLDEAVAGNGQIVFISGESGQGKSALVGEFARRAMRSHRDLLVAGGVCDAYAGIGSPYAPFRDAFTMLSADVEPQWEIGRVSHDHALRLWSGVPELAAALLTRGQELVDVLVDGRVLAAHTAAAMPHDAATIGRIVQLSRRQAERPDVQPERILTQCANVLQMLARQRPLILILDDLQWADSASLSLLFHLGRRLAGCRLLIVGIGRLPGDLRRILDVASVLGETFAAEVVTRLVNVPVPALLARLSRELGRNHRLVTEQGRATVGDQRLTTYAFRHKRCWRLRRTSSKRISNG